MLFVVPAVIICTIMVSSTYEQIVFKGPEQQFSSVEVKYPAAKYEKATNQTSGQVEMGEEKQEATKEDTLNAKQSICNVFDINAPCQCMEMLTMQRVREEGGKHVVIEFPEYVCKHKENERRKYHGVTPRGFTCAQLIAKKTLFRDQNEQPIQVQIRYKAGCELRCTADECPHHAVPKNTKNEAVEKENEEKITSVKKRVNRMRKELMLSDFCKIYKGVWQSFCKMIVNQ